MADTILVPVDTSPFAERALPVALALARHAGMRVRLALVHVPVIVAHVDPAGLGYPIADFGADERAQKDEESYLESIRKRLEVEPGVRLESVMLRGDPAAELAREANASGAILAVMGTHGRGGFSRVWLGSVADEMVRKSPVPVLLVREEGELPIPSTPHQVLVPLDGSELAEAALWFLLPLAERLGFTFRLLRVVVHPEQYDLKLVAELEKDAWTYLDRLAEQLFDRQVRTKRDVVVWPNAAEMILGYAERENVGMIAMSTRGRGGVARALLGSVCDKVVRGSTGPVLVVHPAAPREETPPKRVAVAACSTVPG